MMPPSGYGPYGPPKTGRGRPAVIIWFRVYAVMMPLLYVAFVLVWQFLTPPGSNARLTPEAGPAPLLGLFALFALFAAFYAVAALVPYKPWGWTLGLVAICAGLMTCLAPAAVALLVFWLKPKTKAAFCRL